MGTINIRQLIFELQRDFATEEFFRPGEGNEYRLEVAAEDLPAACRRVIQAARGRLVNMVGTDERPLDGNFRLYYTFALDSKDQFLTLVTKVPPGELTFPAVTPVAPAAHWYEREVRDLLGLVPDGHPDSRRLVLREGWPEGVFPLRKDFDPAEAVEYATHNFPARMVEGEGVCQVPVGPIHAGIIEPGHFRFNVVGEVIINLDPQLFFTHRGLEKRAEGLSFDQALLLAERICGACSFSHSTAYCQAVERLANVVVPLRALYLRSVFLELERLYNHIGDVGNICAGVGFAFGSYQGGRIKEQLMQLNQMLGGNRWLRGINRPGGVKRDLSPEQAGYLANHIERFKEDFRQVTEVILNTPSLRDRLETTGILPTQVAEDLGVVGPAARASGLDRDLRRDHPYAAYDEVVVPVVTATDGDVMARFRVRVEEVFHAFDLITQFLERMPAGQLRVQIPAVPPEQIAMGYTESPRGENIHWLMSGTENTIYRYRIRSASYCNWPAVPFAVEGNIVPDFPLINKSFELCYACLDR